jgi:hypothetical protein
MEEKIVGERRDLPSSLTSLSLLYLSHLSHLSSLYCACARPTTPLWFNDNTGFCVRLNEQYSTGQSDPYGRHQWNGKVGNIRLRWNRTPKNFKILVMGNIPATDDDFVAWREEHFPGLGVRDAMNEYVQHLNLKSKELFDQQPMGKTSSRQDQQYVRQSTPYSRRNWRLSGVR